MKFEKNLGEYREAIRITNKLKVSKKFQKEMKLEK
jgi:hypothetical protein